MRAFCEAMLVALLLCPAAGAQDAPGWYVETRVTQVSQGGSGNTTTRTHVERAWLSSRCSRFEGERYRFDTAAYRLMLDNPRRVLNVVPRDRVVYTYDTMSARIVARELAARQVNRQRVAGPRALGNGGLILGHRTQKYEVGDSIRSYAGEREIARAPSVTTYWVAEDATDPLVAAYRESRAKLLGADRLASFGGLVLRSESRNQWLRDVRQVVTREVVVWRREDVPESRCALPQGFRTASASAETRAMEAAAEELRRLARSRDPADRARAKALGDSLFREMRRALPPARSLRENPRAVIIDSKAAKKP